jgi:hypothetical protein
MSLDQSFCITKDQKCADFIEKTSKRGDKVCVLTNSGMPFIIRSGGDGNYELIGAGYIHGVMDGEAVEWET